MTEIRKRACLEDEIKFFVERLSREKGLALKPLLRGGRRNAIAARKYRIEQMMKRNKKKEVVHGRNELG
jgi:hypothetical protein